MQNSSPVPARHNRSLPPVTIEAHALFEFSLRMNRALRKFENRFVVRESRPIPLFRQTWQPLPNKPR